MSIHISSLQAFLGDVGVDLGGRNAGMAQHLLDSSQVGAGVQQMARKRMS